MNDDKNIKDKESEKTSDSVETSEKPPPELPSQEIEEAQKKRREKLMEISRTVYDTMPSKPPGFQDSPFSRMLFSIPVFILFWWFFWHFFWNK